MLRLPVILLACLSALPASAQHIDQGYREAYAIFGNVSSDIEAVVAEMEKQLPRLEGRWIAVDVVAGGRPEPLTSDAPLQDYERFCSGQGFDLTVTSRLSFQMLQNNPDRPESATLTYRFDYAGFNTFLRSRDTGEYLDRMTIPEDMAVPLGLLRGTISDAIVSVYQPNRDTLVLVNLGGRTEYYGRCP